MKIDIYSNPSVPTTTYAGDGGSNGLFLSVKGCPVSFRFDNAMEAEQIAGAILAGLRENIKREHERGQK